MVEAALTEVLHNMPPERAVRVVDELEVASPPYSAITRRVLALALGTVPQGPAWEHPLDGCLCGQHYRQDEPLALAEATCRLLDQHPDALFQAYNCRRCGYHTGERSWSEWAALRRARPTVPSDASYCDTCPLCGGAVAVYGYQLAHGYRPWQPLDTRIPMEGVTP